MKDLLSYLKEKPTAYFDEIIWFIWDECEVEVSEPTLSRVLKEMQWSRKAVELPHYLSQAILIIVH